MTRIGLTTNAALTTAALSGLEAVIGSGMGQVTRTYGELLRTKVRANASGRPGPRAQTGDYRRSISMEFTAGITPSATVGTNAPQGRRLEWGFMNMTDSLGRRFHQPPYPHFGPALDAIGPEYAAALEQMVLHAVERRA